MSQNDLETRLDELETRLAFQDDVINTLSEQVWGIAQLNASSRALRCEWPPLLDLPHTL